MRVMRHAQHIRTQKSNHLKSCKRTQELDEEEGSFICGDWGRKERVELARRRKNSLKEEVAWRSSMGVVGVSDLSNSAFPAFFLSLSLSLSLSFFLSVFLSFLSHSTKQSFLSLLFYFFFCFCLFFSSVPSDIIRTISKPILDKPRHPLSAKTIVSPRPVTRKFPISHGCNL